MRFRRLLATFAAAAAIGVTAPATTAQAAPTQTPKPTAAVAIGDSFISGEGAGSYQGVTNYIDITQTFQSWTENNKSAFYCHRSANASIQQADLPGIDARFNLACSGGQPHDIVNPSYSRDGGRWVDSQLDQLRKVAETHDIDVVLIGLGSNNSHFTFGDLATKCVEGFLQDAWIGWWEVWAGPWNKNQDPCTASSFPNADTMSAATAETTNAARQILQTLAEIDEDGQHRVVFQDYVDPLPHEIAQEYHTEDGRSDTRDKFRALGRERYAAGCPVHRASLGPAQVFTSTLGNLVRNTSAALAAEFPNADIAYMNVQQAFNGGRLCENSGSPANALATPVRFQKSPNGNFATNMSGWDKLDLRDAANTCSNHFQTCQESLHPNAAGHAVLGQCLAGAAASTAPIIECVRNASTGAVSTTERQPTVNMSVTGSAIPKGGNVVAITANYSITTANAAGNTIQSATVTAHAYGPDVPTFPTSTSTSGTFRYDYHCPDPGQLAPIPGIDVQASVVFAGKTHQLSGYFDMGLDLCSTGGPGGPYPYDPYHPAPVTPEPYLP